MSKKGRKAKVLADEVAVVEWNDRLLRCAHLIIVSAKVTKKFGGGRIKIWIDIQPAGIAGPKIFRTKVKGDVTKTSQHSIVDSIRSYVSGSGIDKAFLPGYIEAITMNNMKDHTITTVKRK